MHRRFSHWCNAGVWERVFDALTTDRDKQYLMRQHLRSRPPAGSKAFEHVFLGALGIDLLERGFDYEVLHGEVDKDGYDVVLEAGGILRHVVPVRRFQTLAGFADLADRLFGTLPE